MLHEATAMAVNSIHRIHDIDSIGVDWKIPYSQFPGDSIDAMQINGDQKMLEGAF